MVPRWGGGPVAGYAHAKRRPLTGHVLPTRGSAPGAARGKPTSAAFSAEFSVRTASAEGRTVPSRSRSHRPPPAQARCAQAVNGESPPRGCALPTRPSDPMRGAAVRGLRRRGALRRCVKRPAAGGSPTQAHFACRDSRGRAKQGPAPSREARPRVCAGAARTTGRRGAGPADPAGPGCRPMYRRRK